MPTTSRLPSKPEARTEKVEDLVGLVLKGTIRVPTFQRGLKWTRENVVDLFDSIYRGYPIGSLLFYKKSAEADRVRVGPLVVDAPELSEAWWVVDGQQRITSLTACLARPADLPTKRSTDDPFVVFFDAANGKFEPAPTHGPVPSGWVPLPHLLDASRLSEWIFGWEHGNDRELRQAVFEAGARIREYPIPLYLIESDDLKVTTEIFYRINQAGRPLKWSEVHKALFGGEPTSPSTLAELSDELGDIGMGRLDEDRLLTCLFALRGKDPTLTLDEHYRRNPEILRAAVQEALPVLRRVLSFLREDAGIRHLRLLPKSILLDTLTRFFHLHPSPHARSRILLARWFWRTVLGAGAFDDRTLRRRGIQAVGEDEEGSVQTLLRLLHKERPRSPELPAAFDARADASRIGLLALAHLGPRNLQTGERLDVAGALEEHDRAAFAKILKDSALEGSRSLANRVLQAPGPKVQDLLIERISTRGEEDPTPASHAITPEAARRLAAGDLEGFLTLRGEALTREIRRFAEGRAAWDHTDRPSVDHFLAEAGMEL